VLGRIGVYEELSAYENLRLFARLYIERILIKPLSNGWSAPGWNASATVWSGRFFARHAASAWRSLALSSTTRRCSTG